MSNMSYCRFQNTVNDLEDCYDHFGDEDISKEEFRARQRIFLICKYIVEEYSEDEEVKDNVD